MEQRFTLIKNTLPDNEKRVLPRFPFSFLTFRPEEGSEHSYEIRDISFKGMQLGLRDGGHPYRVGDNIVGLLQWRGKKMEIKGTVRWVNGPGLGVSFLENAAASSKLAEFLSLDHLVEGLRAIHDMPLEMNIPSNLKYWIKADGPLEVFIWQHTDGELSRFQLILMNRFIEWEDGKGLKTGRILEMRDRHTPLTFEDEIILEIDQSLSFEALDLAKNVIEKIPQEFLPSNTSSFLQVKLGS